MSDVSSKIASRPKIGWNPFAGVAIVLLLYIVSQIFGAIIIGQLYGFMSISDVTAQFLFVLVVEAITAGGLLYYLRSRKAKLTDIGFGKPKLKHVGIGLAVYVPYFIAFVAIIVLATQFIPALNVDQKQELGFDDVYSTSALIMAFISLVVLPPIVEELAVRGLLFTSLRSRMNLLPTTLITSFLFALAHFPAGGFIASIDTFLLSLVLCVLRDKTGSLWPGITLHALKNGIAYFSLFIAPLLMS